MPFYDHYTQDKGVTAMGQRWMEQAAAYTVERVSQLIDPGRRIVEIGPGWGAFGQVCRARRLNYVAIDVNLAILRQLAGGDRIRAFAPPLPLPDDSQDIVIANHVLEHAAGLPQAQALLLEMMRIVRPGGGVVITSPDLLWQDDQFWDCDYSHNFATSARRLRQMFVDLGLQVVWLEYLHNHLTGWKGHLVGSLTRLIPYRLLSFTRTAAPYWDRFYRLRLTFGRSVLIIGAKSEAA